MAKRLQDKVAIVTGSSSGLGRAIARAYSRQGALIVCADLTSSARSLVQSKAETDTDQLIQQDGGKAVFVKTDVTSSQQMENLVAEAVRAFGRLDIMVNNAGVFSLWTIGLGRSLTP